MSAEICGITWERVWCCLTCRTAEGEEPVSLCLVDRGGEVAARWKRQEDIGEMTSGEAASGGSAAGAAARRSAGGTASGGSAAGTAGGKCVSGWRLNITNPGGGRCLPAGRYSLEMEIRGEADPEDPGNAAFSPDSAEPEGAGEESRKRVPVCRHEGNEDILRAADRRFVYGSGAESYAVFFRMTDDGRVQLAAGVQKNKTSGSSASWKNWAKSVYRRGLRRGLGTYYKREHEKKRSGEKPVVLFFTEQSDSLGSNPAALKARMRERHLDRDFRITESCRVAVTARHLSFSGWLSVVKKLAEADVIFMDDHAPVLDWLRLAPDTTVVQLWHAGIGFKASGYSRWGHIASPPPFSCHRQYTRGITGSRKTREVFAEIWGIDEEKVLPLGMPRLDAQFDPDQQEALRRRMREKYPAFLGGKHRKIILFAPTYRGTNRKNAGYPYEKIDFSLLREACGDTWAVIFKMHPWVKEPVPIPEEYRDVFLDLSGRESIEDLYPLADLLITDYSSDIYDFSIRRKPMLFYAFDESEYDSGRGFHLDYEASAPGRVVRDFPSLARAIREEDFQEEKLSAYLERNFDRMDGHASDRIIDTILLHQEQEELR